MLNMHQRYETDPLFRTMVDTMYSLIQQMKATPTEIREAAMLAQIIYEQRNPRPTTFYLDDVNAGRV